MYSGSGLPFRIIVPDAEVSMVDCLCREIRPVKSPGTAVIDYLCAFPRHCGFGIVVPEIVEGAEVSRESEPVHGGIVSEQDDASPGDCIAGMLRTHYAPAASVAIVAASPEICEFIEEPQAAPAFEIQLERTSHE